MEAAHRYRASASQDGTGKQLAVCKKFQKSLRPPLVLHLAEDIPQPALRYGDQKVHHTGKTVKESGFK